jgi:hypothetical protein
MLTTTLKALTFSSILGATLAIGPAPSAGQTCQATPAPAAVAAEGCSDRAEAPMPPQVRSKMFHQLRDHQSFPAGRAAVLESARASLEMTATELAWLAAHLPGRTTYTGPAEVMRALFPTTEAAVLARLESSRPVAVAHR